jgi:hypothetical protein
MQVAESSEKFLPLYQPETRECLEDNIQDVLTIQAQIPLQHSYLSTKVRRECLEYNIQGVPTMQVADSSEKFLPLYQTETRECLEYNIQAVLMMQVADSSENFYQTLRRYIPERSRPKEDV